MQTGCTRAINMLSVRCTNRNRLSLSNLKAMECGRTHNTKANVVVPVVWSVVVAVRRTQIVRCIVPRAAAQHATTSFRGTRQVLACTGSIPNKTRPAQALVTPLPSPLPKGKGSVSETVPSKSAIRWGRTHNTKANVDAPVAWSEEAAERRTQIARRIAPRAAAQHATTIVATNHPSFTING